MALTVKGKNALFSLKNYQNHIVPAIKGVGGYQGVQHFCSATNEVKGNYAKCPRQVFSGIQPTGIPHIGNYLGAIQEWVKLQRKETNVIYSIVDLHSITVHQDPKLLREKIIDMTACLLACGIDHEKCILFQQSDVLEHTELSWILGSFCSLNKLKLLPQWKQKSKESKEHNCGLFIYPILQSADILLYKGTHVPAGEDQVTHIELTGYLARIFNNKYGTFFPRPDIIFTEAKRIRSLRNPSLKMSKSDTDLKSTINLTDSPEEIIEKIKKAKTDFTSAVTYDPTNRPGVSNLLDIHSAFTGDTPEVICEENSLLDTAKYKKVLADVVIESLRPIREQFLRLKSDIGYLETVLKTGADKARPIANNTSTEVKKLVGFR